jgi:L-threonylcarbamoyladenylate synthase
VRRPPSISAGGPVDTSHDAALAKLNRLKVKDRDSPLLLLAADAAQVEQVSSAPPPAFSLLSQAFWPGPLTLVLDDGTGTGVAVRVEGHPVLGSVLRAWGAPISSTSLNRAGESPAVTSMEAKRNLDRMPDAGIPILLVDAGDLPGPPPSTLVSLAGAEPAVLREGALPAESILDCQRGIGRS